MLKFSFRHKKDSRWGQANKSQISLDDEMDDLPLKMHKSRQKSSDSGKTIADSIQYGYYYQGMHSINEKNDTYPQYLKQASETPLVVPPRSQWVPLHKKSRWSTWKRSFKNQQQQQECINVPDQNYKTGWGLSGMEFKRRVTSGFSFKKRDSPVSIPENDADLESEDCSTLNGPSSIVPERVDSNLEYIRYSNYYMPGEGGSWIFVHRDHNGRILGQYEIKGSCI